MAKKVLDINEKSRERYADYKKVFSSEAGQRVVRDLIDTHYMLRPTYDAKDTNLNVVLVREGERSVILRILTILKVDPELFLKRLEEIEKNV